MAVGAVDTSLSALLQELGERPHKKNAIQRSDGESVVAAAVANDGYIDDDERRAIVDFMQAHWDDMSKGAVDAIRAGLKDPQLVKPPTPEAPRPSAIDRGPSLRSRFSAASARLTVLNKALAVDTPHPVRDFFSGASADRARAKQFAGKASAELDTLRGLEKDFDTAAFAHALDAFVAKIEIAEALLGYPPVPATPTPVAEAAPTMLPVMASPGDAPAGETKGTGKPGGAKKPKKGKAVAGKITATEAKRAELFKLLTPPEPPAQKSRPAAPAPKPDPKPVGPEANGRSEAELRAAAIAYLDALASHPSFDRGSFLIDSDILKSKPKHREALALKAREKMRVLRERVAAAMATDEPVPVRLKAVRKLVLEAGLFRYRKSNVDTVRGLTGAGGNCVLQTKVLAAVLGTLPEPPGWHWGIQSYAGRTVNDSGHIQFVAWSESDDTVVNIVGGNTTRGRDASLYAPPALELGWLKAHGGTAKIDFDAFLVAKKNLLDPRRVDAKVRVKPSGPESERRIGEELNVPADGLNEGGAPDFAFIGMDDVDGGEDPDGVWIEHGGDPLGIAPEDWRFVAEEEAPSGDWIDPDGPTAARLTEYNRLNVVTFNSRRELDAYLALDASGRKEYLADLLSIPLAGERKAMAAYRAALKAPAVVLGHDQATPYLWQYKYQLDRYAQDEAVMDQATLASHLLANQPGLADTFARARAMDGKLASRPGALLDLLQNLSADDSKRMLYLSETNRQALALERSIVAARGEDPLALPTGEAALIAAAARKTAPWRRADALPDPGSRGREARLAEPFFEEGNQSSVPAKEGAKEVESSAGDAGVHALVFATYVAGVIGPGSQVTPETRQAADRLWTPAFNSLLIRAIATPDALTFHAGSRLVLAIQTLVTLRESDNPNADVKGLLQLIVAIDAAMRSRRHNLGGSAAVIIEQARKALAEKR